MKYIFFDLDGTLVDSTHIFIESFNELTALVPFIKKLDKKEFVSIPIEDLIKKYHVPKIVIPLVMPILRYKFFKKANKVKKFPFTDKILNKLKQNYKIGLLTTSNRKYTNIVLKNNELENSFHTIITNCSLLNKSKNIKNFLKNNTLKKSDIILISDEARDIKSFNKAKIPVIGVTWGFDSFNVISKVNNEYIANNYRELIDIIHNNSKN